MLYTILIIILVLALLGGIPTGGYGLGYYGHGGLGLLLVIVILILLLR